MMRQDVVRGGGRRGWRGQQWVEALEGRQLLTVASVGTMPDLVAHAGAGVQAVELGGYFSDPAVPADTVFIQTTLGTIPVELTPGATPKTVANFMNYVTSGRYDGTFFHRVEPGFVIQGGGFGVQDGQVTLVQTDPPVVNEYSASRLNSRGTIAMAKTSDPDSATSQFFFNLADNSSSLNNTGNSGGFTVFGSIVGQQGLQVMDAIGGLQYVNGNSSDNPNGPFTKVPVIPAAQGQQSIFDQLVYVNSVTSGAAFTATSDDPSVLAVGVRDSRLLYQAQGQGTAHVTVTATGLDGQAVSQTFAVTVGAAVSGTAVTIGGQGGAKSLTFTDRDGTVTTIAVKGPGSATVTLAGKGVSVKTAKGLATAAGRRISVASIELDGATAKTVVSVETRGGNGSVDVGGIVAAGAMGTLDGAGVNLVGATIVGGAVKSMTIRSAAKGSSIEAGSVGMLSASGDVAADVTVSGAVRSASVDGTLGGTWQAGRVKRLSAGSIVHGTVATTGSGTSMGTVSVGSMTRGKLWSAGGIASVDVAGAMTRSQVYAGVATDGSATPEDAAGGAGTIGSIRAGAFAKSAIAAGTVRNGVLGNVLDAGGTAALFGVEADLIVSLTGAVDGKAFSLKRAGTQQKADAQLAKENVTLKKVRIVVV